MILDRLHGWSLRTQVVVMLGCVAFISATLTGTLVTMGVQVALDGAPRALVHRATTSVGVIAVFIALCTVLSSLGAAAFLRSSIGRIVRELEQATATIASGGFDHRIASARCDELGRLAHAIDGMAARLSELERARQQLLAAVSHELRTPLTVIRGHAFTLGRSETDDRRRERLELIDTEVERLARMIDELLTASTLRAASVVLDPQPAAAGDLLHAAAQRFRAQASGRGVGLRVAVDSDVRVLVDSPRVHQVIGNLLANAIAHAPAASVVELRVARPRGRAREVRVHVSNAGPGIPRDRIDTIFEPFMQGPLPTGSVGLGLAIARDLVRAHGGELSVRSRPGRTVFSFDLPLAAGGQRASRPEPAAAVRAPGYAS